MIIAASIKQLLDTFRLGYRVLQHQRVTDLEVAASLLGIDPNKVLAVQVLGDNMGEVLVVYPLGRKIDFTLCMQLLNRKLQCLPPIEVNRLFNDCEADCWPAVGQPYNLDIVLDKSIKSLDKVYFASGSHTAFIQMATTDFFVLNARSKILAITSADTINVVERPAEEQTRISQAVLDSLTFPQLPPEAMQILQLSMNKDHSLQDLIELVAQDPAMQQQIMSYAQLPFNQGKTNSFAMVSHIALGVAAGRAFNGHRIDGMEDFWRHAFYAATYAERITELVAEELQLDPAISYLAGLFHNFGLLLFSQLYPPEYNMLKKWLELNPKVSIAVLEKRLLGMGHALNVAQGGHAQLGEWLLRHWQMPESICVITREHHSLTYKGKYANYVRIIQLTNQLLRAEGIGDGTMSGISAQLLEPLGLSVQQINDCLVQVRASAASLDNMARSLTNI